MIQVTRCTAAHTDYVMSWIEEPATVAGHHVAAVVDCARNEFSPYAGPNSEIVFTGGGVMLVREARQTVLDLLEGAAGGQSGGI